MEGLKERIAEFLTVEPSSYGYGYGSGIGYGYGDGSGSGYGSGIGYGYGDGDGSSYVRGYDYFDGSGSGYGSGIGYGSGDGYGDGSGIGYGYGDGYGSGDNAYIKSFCGFEVNMIDDVSTIIERVHGNVAKGYILKADLTTTPCYVAKVGRLFAHGETLHDAMNALRGKLFEGMHVEERIASFMREHDLCKVYSCRDLYDWHHRLTGSCEMGRKEFAKTHEIDIENDSMTVEQFINLTRNAYGGDVILALEKAYKEKTEHQSTGG